MRRGQRGDARNVVAYRRATNRFFVIERFAPEGRVDHQIDFARFHQVHNVGAALVYFENGFGFDAGGFQRSRGSASGQQSKTQRRELPSECPQMVLVTVVDTEEDRPLARQALPRGKLGLRERLSTTARNSHTFAGRTHLRTKNRVDTTEL